MVYWVTFRPMLVCAFPVAFWAFFRNHLENCSKEYNIFHFWLWNIFANVWQIYFITTLVLNHLPIEASSSIQSE